MNFNTILAGAKNQALATALSKQSLNKNLQKEEKKLDHCGFNAQEKSQIFHKMANTLNHRANELDQDSNHYNPNSTRKE